MKTNESRLTTGPITPPALIPWTTKLPNTSTRIRPAIIATNGRRPRLKGRTMNEMNSIGTISNLRMKGVPWGTNSERKWSLWRQKPMISTIEKLMTAITLVTLNWLVTVNGWAPTRASGITPSRFANRKNMKIVNTQGRYLRPSGPMLVVTIDSTKPVIPSTATCQRPGTSWRFIPPSMNSQISASTTSIHRALLVKTNGLPSRFPTRGLIWNWIIGSILALAATLVFPLSPVRTLLRNLPDLPNGGAEPEEQHRQHHPAGADQAIDRPADQRAPGGVADQDGQH